MADSPLQQPSSRRGVHAKLARSAARSVLPAALLLCAWGNAGAQAARSCDEWSAEITIVEGSVEVQRYADTQWQSVRSGDRVCSGDSIRVLAASRTTLTLPDDGTLRLAELTTLVLQEPDSDEGSLIELIRGLIHVISRDPRSLRFTTPYANAGLEGTEFDIGVNDAERQTEVAVLEGEVSLATPLAQIKVGSGHLAVARQNQAPTVLPLAAPIELMRWASYYAPIVDQDLPAPDQPPLPSEERNAEFFALRAAARLGTARTAAAQLDLDTALRLEPQNATALALEAMIALARSDSETARQRLATALAAEPTRAVALIALSHVEQSAGEFSRAEQSARRVLTAEPDSALALTRLAELTLARGDVPAAIALAEHARTRAPARSAPLVVLGFAHWRAQNARAAQTAFEQAATAEPEAPLPRLGLALTAIQRGDLAEGRRQLELAVANDPANALTRSYMAKVYDTEHRTELTAGQLDLAKSFDPQDPTAWLYSALQRLRTNRPVEALHDLRSAVERNGGRAVSRSRLVLDEDLATRSAGLSRVHTELGFGRLALVDAWQAAADRPEDYAGHRLLADLYSMEPRHEIARVSELLVAQLLQPINMTPVKPQLAQPSLFVAQRAGPSASSFDEFTAPLASDGLKLSVSSARGGNGTLGTEIAAAGLADRLAYGAGHYRFETDGFRANNDLDQRIANAFVQFRPNHATNLQAELRSVRTEYGDLTTQFDRGHFLPLIRNEEDTQSLRLGGQRRLANGDTLLASVIYQDAAAAATDPLLNLDADRESYSVDVQHIRGLGLGYLQTGAVYAEQDDRTTSSLAFPGSPAIVTDAHSTQQQVTLYSYAHLSPIRSLTLTVGASIDAIDDLFVDERAFNPKLGVMWRPTTRTTIRAAAFRTLFGSLTTSVQNPQPRLEPVQLAGFTQLVFGGAADRARVRGLAVDHEATDRVFLGWEAMLRDTDRPLVNFGLPGTVERVNLDERSQQGYLYWTPSDRFSFVARYEKGRYTSEPLQLFGYSRMEIERLPLELRYFAPVGLTAGLRASNVRQAGLFQTPALSPFDPPILTPGQDEFWLLDAFIGYRLPNRRGSLSLNADNLLDQAFRFQDIDPTNPSVFPERLLSLRFTLAFD